MVVSDKSEPVSELVVSDKSEPVSELIIAANSSGELAPFGQGDGSVLLESLSTV